MKTASIRASCILFSLLAPSSFSGGWEMKGGIVYWRLAGYTCPAPQLTQPMPTHFAIENKVGVICPFTVGPQRCVFTFVLGPLDPGSYWMKESSPLPGSPEFSFTIPASSEQLVTNIALNVSGQLTFHVNGYGDVRYVVQKTSDFATWNNGVTLIGESDFTETAVSTEPVYYRIKIVAPPPTVIP